MNFVSKYLHLKKINHAKYMLIKMAKYIVKSTIIMFLAENSL